MDALTRTKLRRMDARLKRLEALAAIGPSLLALAAAYQPPPIELGGTPSTEPSTATQLDDARAAQHGDDGRRHGSLGAPHGWSGDPETPRHPVSSAMIARVDRFLFRPDRSVASGRLPTPFVFWRVPFWISRAPGPKGLSIFCR